MKKYLLLTVTLFCLNNLSAQIIPNSDFENWSTENGPDEPLYWTNNNSLFYSTSQQTAITKSSDNTDGSSSLTLTSLSSNGSVFPAGVAIGEIPSSLVFKGGMPFSEKPDSISFDYKNNHNTNDSAVMLIYFKQNGAALTYQQIMLGGVHNSFVHVKLPILYLSLGNPDSLYFLLLSSYPYGPAQAGSTITVDNIVFHNSTTQLPNNSFEDWFTPTYQDPDGWSTFNKLTYGENKLSVTRTSTAKPGTSAIWIETMQSAFYQTVAASTTGYFSGNGADGGFPITGMPKKLGFYYQYHPVENDKGMVVTYFLKNGVKIDSTVSLLNAASTYTYHEITLKHSFVQIPDQANILLASSDLFVNPTVARYGSRLLVDSLHFTGNLTGIQGIDPDKKLLRITPNPASSVIEIDGADVEHISITDVSGKIMMKSKTTGRVDISSLPSGVYIIHAENIIPHRFVIVR